MPLDERRQLVTQLVESSRILRNYIDHRAKQRGTTRAQWVVLYSQYLAAADKSGQIASILACALAAGPCKAALYAESACATAAKYWEYSSSGVIDTVKNTVPVTVPLASERS